MKFVIAVAAMAALTLLAVQIKRSEPRAHEADIHQEAKAQLKSMGGSAGY